MAFWRKKKSKTTEHFIGDFGSAEIEQEQLGSDPDTLHELHVYAVSLGELPERLDEAIELLEWLVDARADDEENRLLALNDLTRLLEYSGRLTLTEQRLREALTGWERLRGQDDPQTLHIAVNLARVLLDLRRPAEAEGLMRDTVARCTRTLGATHTDTIRSRNYLAGTLRGTPARLAEAERMYRSILAALLVHQGNLTEALKQFRQLIDARSRLQGTDHEDTWVARHNYAVVLSKVGDTAKAESELVDVLKGYQRAFGRRHASTLDVQVDLAALRANQGRNAEAVPLLRDAIEGYRDTHGPDHPLVRELTSILAQLRG